MHRATSGALCVCALVVYAFLYTPLVVLILFSLSASDSGMRWEGFTFKWYVAMWEHPHIGTALGISLLVALPAVGVATALGTVTALALYRHRFRGQGMFQGVLYIPLIMPSLLLGIALLLLFVALQIELGVLTIVLAHIAFCLPLTTLVILARLQRLDPRLEEAAMDLGADAWTAFWKVTFPLLRPGILAAALLAFPWSFNDFVITFFVAGVGASTLPLRVYAMIRLGVSPLVNALGTLIVVLPLLAVLLGTVLNRQGRLWRRQ